ncbi:MAG TPA: acyl-CoA dehydrogenase family protein [Gaiellaceae bacterium]|nr:acyl-CoA dehydrogenase family protein [Gaiellaceae bacterium]
MDFSFTQEQEDLRREARTFLEANPSPTQEQLEQLGWVGLLSSDDFTFLDAAVLFEELGRVLYDGSFVENEVRDDRNALLTAYALEAVGIGSHAVELAVAYVSEREQFGKKIGTYQAVSHPVVDAYVAVELARSLAYWAAWCVAEHDPDAARAAAAAKSQAAEAAVRACETSIQVHGGIGFTWEHPLHRYYKRALRLEGALGYGREHRAEIAASLLSS